MQALLSAVRALNARVEWLLRRLDDLANKVRWSEQRIRELSSQLGNGGGAAYGPSTAATNFAVFKVTTQVSKMSGTTFGSGVGTRYSNVGGVATVTTETGVPLLSTDTQNKILVNAYVYGNQDRDGNWFATGVDSCANLST